MRETQVGMTDEAPPERLVDLLDRLLHHGVVAEADVSIGIADTELVRISLRAVAATAFKLSARLDGAEQRMAGDTCPTSESRPLQ
ncbi:MAG: gas vesicle protein [Pseudomonadota bacterium]